MVQWLRLFPFTMLMLAILVVMAAWTRSHLDELPPSVRGRFGFSPLHLPSGEWTRMLSSAFLTVGGTKFYASALMLVIGVGAAEGLYGTRRAFVLFWAIHFATLLLASFVVAMLVGALWLLHAELRQYHLNDFLDGLAKIPTTHLWLAVGLTVLNYVILIGCDLANSTCQ